MSFILIDRRTVGKGKSLPNREKLIKRIKSFIKSSMPQNVGAGAQAVGGHSNVSSPVKISGKALEEPYFAYARDGERTLIIIGNTEYNRGDEIELPSEEKSSGGGGPGDRGEDDFVINVAKDEFFDLFFEDCELPNLTHEKYTEKSDNTQQPAGFSTNGTPAQLSIIRTFKQALGRRKALTGPYLEEKEALETELLLLTKSLPIVKEVGQLLPAEIRIAEIEVRLEELANKFIYLDNFDKSDLRYRKKEPKPLKTVDAVLIMVMDISGSMGENEKTIARRWFALMYAFIKRRYERTELVFIAHTDEAFEMSEDDFFSTRVNGGTSVSPALKMVSNIVKERYNPNETNIYVSHASDGDNWPMDNDAVIAEMSGPGYLVDKLQMFSYVEVGKKYALFFGNKERPDTNLWCAYEEAQGNVEKNKMVLSIIETADDCYEIFKRVFKKKKS
jgi:uncharacterized sporulation protein YeaH/YhbH (DUF444 family)